MTYSICVKGDCKTDALLKFDDKVDACDLSEKDRSMICAQAREAIAILGDPNYDEAVLIHSHGYVVNNSGDRPTSVCFAVTSHIVIKSP